MKKVMVFMLAASLLFTACSSKKETAASLGKKWCELNAKVHNAKEGPAKEAAELALDKFEEEIEKKYEANREFLKEVENEAEKCEAASEGR
jgi:ABC-type glycerol-3-phosphate transport system substrate-binding protein